MRVDQQGPVTIARLDPDYSGFDEEHLTQTQEALLDVIDRSQRPLVVLDMSATEYVGSTFLESLFRVWHRINRRHGRFALAAMQPYCREVLHIARLDTLWSVYESVDEAAQAVQAEA